MSSIIKNTRNYGLFIIIASFIGLLASFELVRGKLIRAENPDAVLSCDISPFASCGTVMTHWQSELFGFPNQLIGLIAYPIALFFGVLILSKVELPKWIHLSFNVGVFLGVVFTTWLFTQSVFVIGVLCPWCILVWAVQIPLFVFVTTSSIKQGFFRNFAETPLGQYLLKVPTLIVITWYLIIVFSIAFVFRLELSTLF